MASPRGRGRAPASENQHFACNKFWQRDEFFREERGPLPGAVCRSIPRVWMWLFDTLDNLSRRCNATLNCSEPGDDAIGGLLFEVADGFRVSELCNQLIALFEKFAQ